MNNFGERLFKLRREKKLARDALGAKIGVSKTAIKNWEDGENVPKLEYMQALADFFKVDFNFLATGEALDPAQQFIAQLRANDTVQVDLGEDDSDDIEIPIYSVIFCCGDGNNAVYDFEEIKGHRKFPPEFFSKKGIKPENFKLLCAGNDSMAPYINDGDEVGINLADTEVREGEVYAILLDDERMFKQIFREGNGILRLHSFNANYPDKLIDRSNGKTLKIVGRQVYRAG